MPWSTSFGQYDAISTKDLVSGQEVSQIPRESNKHGVSARLQNEPSFNGHPPAVKIFSALTTSERVQFTDTLV